jgi:hypothetical protein
MPAVFEHIVDKLPHFRIVIDDENRAHLFCHPALLLSLLMAGRQRLALYSRRGQGHSGAKGDRRASLLGRNATRFAVSLRFQPTYRHRSAKEGPRTSRVLKNYFG